MALPVGVSTCVITFGSPASGFAGEEVSASLSVQPTATLVWAATGQPVIDFTIPASAEAGMPGQIALPHVDQPGFRDQAGNEITHWAYIVSGSWKSGAQSKPFRRVLQPLVGQSSIDLDLVPEGVAVSAVSAPTLPVTSLAGLTGAVTAQQVQAILDAGVPAEATWDTVTGKPSTFPPSAHGHVITEVEGLEAALDTTGGGGGLTTEQVQDLVAAMLVEGANIDIAYDATAGTVTVTGAAGDGSYSASDTGESMRIIVFSNGTVKAVPYAAVPPATPTGLTGAALVASVSLTWTPAARAAQYRVYRDSVVIATVSSPFYGDYAVTTGSTYAYKVQAVDQFGQMSGLSSQFVAAPDPSLNVAPTIEVRTWPAELPETGKVLVRANVKDVDAQSLAVQFGVSAGSITPTPDPSLWLLTL